MDIAIRDRFIGLWKRFFNDASLPLTFHFTDNAAKAPKARKSKGHRCIIADLGLVKRGKSLLFDSENLGCMGSRRYLGFAKTLCPEFNYFLSCGIPGKLEGERYKKSPEVVGEFMRMSTFIEAVKSHVVFKRWDMLVEDDEPEVVIFLERPDVIAGLFTLSNYDRSEPFGVITPFGSACMSTMMYPLLEGRSENPRAVLGLWDPSARPFLPPSTLSLSLPFKRFLTLLEYMEESFLSTPTWEMIQHRIR
ncbi:MAG: DUF169 domain-containing protein [Candidatus Xenobiia bacterium LiM19]